MSQELGVGADFPILADTLNTGMERIAALAAANDHLRSLLNDEISGEEGLAALCEATFDMLTQLGPDRACSFVIPFAWLMDDKIVARDGRIPLNDNFVIALVTVVDDGVAMAWKLRDGIHRNFDRREELTSAYPVSVGGDSRKSPVFKS